MERHFSTGTATIVALMAAHRLASCHDDRELASAFREEVAALAPVRVESDSLTRTEASEHARR
jgi:hypothetical protein